MSSTTARARARAILALLAVSALTAVVVPGPAGAAGNPSVTSDEQTVTLLNQDADGEPTIRFDVDGEAIDAHDGQIQRFGDTYYLYGTTYGCGYEWNTPGAPFCGFVAYSSPDLVHWTALGELFDASTPTWQERCDGATYGCYRPHVVYNESTGRYVLWINTYDNGSGYRVLTATDPAGPFTEVAEPDLAAPEGAPGGVNYGDHQVFVDHDGQAYLAFTDWIRGGDLIVERLDDTYTTGTGDWTRVNIRSTEAPTIFERGGTYYLTYSDPNRGYTTTGTGYVTAPSPLGPWSGTGSTPDAWSVSDGVLHVEGGDVGLSRDGQDWTDYTFSATATPLEAGAGGYGQMGFVVRASDAGSYQWLIGNYPHSGATGGNLTKLIPGHGATTVPLPLPIVTGQAYDVDITVDGDTIETRIDGELVDTTTATASGSGRVGFRESGSDRERVAVDAARVVAADGTVLLADDFDDGLEQWDRPASSITGTNITRTSCGGQPTDVLPLETSQGTVYLYQSDVWMDAKPNEALAKHYWQPLAFGADGQILPIGCERSYDVTIPVGEQAQGPEPAAVSTGHVGYRTHWDVRGGLARSQGFTVPDDGLLTAARFTTFQSDHPDAPLVLELREAGDDGVAGDVVATSEIPPDEISWAASWAEVRLDEPREVRAGDRFVLVARTSSTAGSYGIAYSDTTPYPGGVASISHDSGATWSVEAGRVLHVEADVQAAADPQLVVTAQSRCLAGAAYVAVRATNDDEVPVAIRLSTPFGDSVSASVAPGRSAYQSFAVRAPSVGAGSVTVTGSLPDGEGSQAYPVTYDALSCTGE
ncbi:family 43 glycosylhydrolase [Cellulosimicrobium arenosum]|uniref:Family 43 glycosylhydrolase n=1 Tax=Cellulosimicrobium arenosum TaxID=2708133 RepID=A0A927PFQ1_9MICO|nr:family 43 glycosylhydrolase [Cellulosimicrobium arenosum]MBD8079865.1 family 43 glycosylhydrolase [Cellulosimicrobium arenosum]